MALLIGEPFLPSLTRLELSRTTIHTIHSHYDFPEIFRIRTRMHCVPAIRGQLASIRNPEKSKKEVVAPVSGVSSRPIAEVWALGISVCDREGTSGSDRQGGWSRL